MTPADVRLLRDTAAMRGAVGGIPLLAGGRAHLSALAFERLWVKPGRHCHAAYRATLDTDGGPVHTLVSAALVRERGGGEAMLRTVGALPLGAAPWPASAAVALVESPRALVQLFPWDHRLPTLARALDCAEVATALGLRTDAATPVGYWPGIRCQLRYETAEGTLFGKVFPDASGSDVARRLAALAASLGDAGAPAVPAVRAWVPSLHLLVTTPLAGTPLIERLSHGATAEEIAEVAGALAWLHSARMPVDERRFGPGDDLAIVRGWVAFVGEVLPDLREALGRALVRIEAARPPDATALVPVHRDFYDKQVLVGSSRLGVLDLDTLCHGDAEIDVGNFCAHLVLRGLQWHDAEAAFAPLGVAFVEAYGPRRGRLDPDRLRWYEASALLRLACLYALRPRWSALAPRLSQEALRVVG